MEGGAGNPKLCPEIFVRSVGRGLILRVEGCAWHEGVWVVFVDVCVLGDRAVGACSLFWRGVCTDALLLWLMLWLGCMISPGL